MVEEAPDSPHSSLGPTRRSVMKGAAWTVPALMVATAAPAYALSCVEGNWTALGRGRMLSGGLFDIDLDTLASVDGTIASAPGLVAETGFTHGPNADGDPDKHANPLSVTALGAINVTATGLTTTVSQLLGLIASAPDGTGLLNQFGLAQSNGLSMGASGYVDDNGTVRVAPSGGYPQVASLDLKQFLTPLLGSAATGFLANVTDLKLDVGALVGRAVLEQMCNTTVNAQGYELTREYLVAYLRLVVTSPLVGNLLTALTGALPNLQVDTDLVWAALSAVPVLAPIIALGKSALTVRVAADAGQLVTDLTSAPIPNGPDDAIALELGAGTVTADIGKLLGPAFPGGSSAMANSLPANSVLFVDYPLPTNALSSLVAKIQDTIIQRVQDHVTVTISVGTTSGLGATGLLITGTLAQFLNGAATPTIVALGAPLNLGALLGPLLQNLGNIVKGSLFAAGGTVDVALTALNGLLAAIFDALKNLVNITLNVQNLPDANNNPSTPANGAGPARWASGAQALPAGRFDVAALGISAVTALPVPSALDLFLARGSVGPHTAV